MKCPKCEGKGFVEFNHGLFQVACADCNATGEVEEVHPELHEIVENREENDDNSARIGPDNSTSRSTDTSKSKKPQKQKVRKATSKRTR